MQRLRATLRPYIGSGPFYKSALAVMLPVTVQQLVNNLFNIVDNLMVGSLDMQGLAMSAVSVANKPTYLFQSFLFGMAGGAGLLISQYFGARNRKACMGIFWMEMWLGLLNGAVFFALMFGFSETVMRIFVTDSRTIALGVSYLRIESFSYLPAAVSGVCIFALRSIGQNRTSMMVSLGSMALNATLNYLLIFGKLGFPQLGVRGAAWGTLIARLFEMSFYLTLMLRRRMYFGLEPSSAFTLSASERRQFGRKTRPLIANELLYSLGLNIFFWCFYRMDEAAIPALTIAELCFQISSVIIMGNSSAISVLIGTALGAGRLREAKENCKKLFTLTFVISLVSTALGYGLAFLMPRFYNITPALRLTATHLSCLLASFTPFNFLYAFCFFCLRAGGDTRAATLLDSGLLWAMPVPAAMLMGLLLPGKLSLLVAVIIVYSLENIRIVPALAALKKGRWIRNITMEGPA